MRDITNQQSKKLYSSLNNESIRIFKSPLLEKLTYVHPAVPHIIYIPVAILMLCLSHQYGVPVEKAIGLFIAGALTWSLAEYTMHRYLFHIEPKNKWQYSIWYLFHGVHHDFPNDKLRLVMPPTASIPLAIIFFFIFKLAFGPTWHYPFFAGFAIGYLIYDTAHYLVHSKSIPGKTGRYLKQQHMKHHFKDPDHNFGVSSPFWDMIFGTLSRK